MTKTKYVIESTHIYKAPMCAVCKYYHEELELPNKAVFECHRKMPDTCYVIEPDEKCDYFTWHEKHWGEYE